MLLSVRAPQGAVRLLRRGAMRWCSEAAEKEALPEAVAPEKVLTLPMYKMAEALRRRHCTAEDLTAAALKKLQQETAIFNCVTSVSAAAINEAAVLDEHLAATGKTVGPLHGVPVVVSDDTHVEGFPTTLGSANLAHYVPNRSAPVVDALRAAGAIVLGKSNMDEYGLAYVGDNASTGEMVHPASPNHHPGGAHGGAALCVATESVGCAVGGDCVGELRIPASLTRQVAFVPTPGRYSRKRMWLSSGRQGGAGVLARCVEDIAILDSVLTASAAPEDDLALLAGKPTPPLDPTPRPVLMVPEETFADASTLSVDRLFKITLVILRNLSCSVNTSVEETKGRLPRAKERLQEMGDDDMGIGSFDEDRQEQLRAVMPLWLQYSQLLEWEAVSRALGVLEKAGREVADPHNIAATARVQKTISHLLNGALTADIENSETTQGKIAALLTEYFGLLSDSVDCLIFPTARAEAHQRAGGNEEQGLVEWYGPTQERDYLIRNCALTSAAGFPSITVPFGKNQASGTSGGLLLVGRPGDDERLLACAATVETRLRQGFEELVREEELRASATPVQEHDGPAWLEDRSKNEWAARHDYKAASYKQGPFRQGLIRNLVKRGLADSIPEETMKRHVTRTSAAYKEYTDGMTGITAAREKEEARSREILEKDVREREAAAERKRKEHDDSAAEVASRLQNFK
eukprot:TRINITY_DN2273_c0_g1_i2.p1 TRINITY_DN2273_c0_g1~~TRINITY_DN2273_c0_g1_i2.p1  ORF type:complete len:691 (+),score=217.40 TRINITY_DN2273_c0_g1_i2:61-2133(+)